MPASRVLLHAWSHSDVILSVMVTVAMLEVYYVAEVYIVANLRMLAVVHYCVWNVHQCRNRPIRSARITVAFITTTEKSEQTRSYRVICCVKSLVNNIVGCCTSLRCLVKPCAKSLLNWFNYAVIHKFWQAGNILTRDFDRSRFGLVRTRSDFDSSDSVKRKRVCVSVCDQSEPSSWAGKCSFNMADVYMRK